MGERTQSKPTLPANRAFVVQFRPADPEGSTRFEGRIEHLASGYAEFFMLQDELWEVIDHLLPDTHKRRHI
jgi:hypothetical protein